jgi:dolichol-phosphate mannosyltransferase
VGDASTSTQSGVELSVIVPTFNERDNVAELVRRLHIALEGVRWEVIFVDDDSPDGTSGMARSVAAVDGRTRCIQRIGRRGLSTACIEGMLASCAPYLAVIDGDMQHDESLLPKMLQELQGNDLDVVVGSRYVAGGSVGNWKESRALMSRIATSMGRRFVPPKLTDPMSGFFMMRREALDLVVRNLSAVGFKILLDVFASSPRPLKFTELPYEFRNRVAGESKLDSQVMWEYLMLLADKMVGRYVPVRFVAFTLVGAVGMLVHFAVLTLSFRAAQLSFIVAQTIATVIAMTFNYAVNNVLTYRDMRLRGLAWWRGWLTFIAGCSIGAAANVGIASYLFKHSQGWVLAAMAGIVVGAVWNYAITFFYTWGGGSKAKRK